MEEKFLTIPEFAKKLGISRIAVFKKVKKGQLEAIRIGRNWAIPVSGPVEIREKSPKYSQKNEIPPSFHKIINSSGSNVDNSVDKVDKSQKDDNMESMGWD